MGVSEGNLAPIGQREPRVFSAKSGEDAEKIDEQHSAGATTPVPVPVMMENGFDHLFLRCILMAGGMGMFCASGIPDVPEEGVQLKFDDFVEKAFPGLAACLADRLACWLAEGCLNHLNVHCAWTTWDLGGS